MLRAVLFDLDGTLLPMNQDEFVKLYFGALAAKMATKGLDPKKLIQAVSIGTNAMVNNDGTMTNEKRFWTVYEEVMKLKAEDNFEDFLDFYQNEFINAKEACGLNPYSNEVVQIFKKKGFRLICATNPLFPEIATLTRMKWAGLNPEDFELITTYEKCSYCKPNVDYYKEILEKIGLESNEVLMVGNDVKEDLVVKELGIEANLITDDLINRENLEISARYIGTMKDFREFVNKEY